MKKITIEGREFFYEVRKEDDYGFSFGTRTIFYDPTPKIIKRKKYYFFGKDIEIRQYKSLFIMYINIESPKYSKCQTKELLTRQIQILNRKEEIERGEIV